MDKNALIRALRDTAQSASNAIASNISGPVDLIAAGLRAGGLPVNNPVGGSQWMAEKGLTRDVEMGVPRIVGETMGMAGPALAANFAPQIAMGINQAAANAMAPRTLNPQTGAIVWHGSPHKFDKFDSSKIGTGEGAQAYGHGLYLAEAPEVAGTYRFAGDATQDLTYNGRPIKDEMRRSAAYLMHLNNYDKEAAKAVYQGKTGEKLAKIIDKMDAGKIGGGSLYKVDLPDEHIAKMLDWDKPLSQQHPDVQSVIRNIAPTAKPYDIPIDHDPTGAQFYGMFSAPTEIGQRGASQSLKDAGIPGIRYLDGGSRGAGGGTSNFVVFPGNESLLQILERNGQPLGLMGVR